MKVRVRGSELRYAQQTRDCSSGAGIDGIGSTQVANRLLHVDRLTCQSVGSSSVTCLAVGGFRELLATHVDESALMERT